MSIIFMDGFDKYGSGDDLLLFSQYFLANKLAPTEAADIVINTSEGRFGNGVLKIHTSESDESLGVHVNNQTDTLRVAFSFRYGSFGSDILFGLVLDNGNFAATIYPNSGTLELRNLVESNTSTGWSPVSNTWYWVELEFVKGASGSITLYANGTEQYTGTHDLSDGNNFDYIMLSDTQDDTNNDIRYDDLVIWNNDGSSLTSFPMGDSRIETLKPNGLGDTVELSPQGDSSNELTLNESPGPDGDTTYNVGDIGQTDLLTFENLSTSPTTIYAIQVGNYLRKDGIGFRSNTNEVKSGTTQGSYSFSTNLEEKYIGRNTLIETNPDTGSSWTETEINNIQAGYSITSG